MAPWLSVRDSASAVEFYKTAFGAKEVYRLEAPDGGVVARLSVHAAELWLSDESPKKKATAGVWDVSLTPSATTGRLVINLKREGMSESEPESGTA